MSVFFVSDLHLGHENMAIHRGFANAEDMNLHIITKWNSVVNKRDMVYILGDITMEKSLYYPMLDLLKGDKNVILGNHDMKAHVPLLLKHVLGVAGMMKYKDIFLLTHCPVHPSELNFKQKYNIHGHNHDKRILKDPSLSDYLGEPDERYINVALEQLDYTPIEFTDLMNTYCKL